MSVLYYDSETYSGIPIKYGSHRYSEGAELLLVTYAFDDQPVQVWDCKSSGNHTMPLDLFNALKDPKVKVIIHNSQFDLAVLKKTRGIEIPANRIHDTVAQARSVGLPGALGTLCDVLRVTSDKAKDKHGHELIRLFCVPRPKNSTLKRATYETHPQEWQQFIEYAKSDIDALRAVYNKLPLWNFRDRELALWQLDRRINEKGLHVDKELAESAIRAVAGTKKRLNTETSEATFGLVGSTTQREELLGYILGIYGIDLPDMQASTLERRLNDPELPQGVKDLLTNRLQTCTTSTAKYQTLLNCMSEDGRLRGTMEFCGAGRTGRWCLAENTQVAVKHDNGEIENVNIQDVKLKDEVWDGDEWVAHEGVVFSGEKEVMNYDNIIATSEHIVYISSTESTTLGDACRRNLILWEGNPVIKCTD